MRETIKSSDCSNGFTIIELLCVIVIIAFLAALLTPSLSLSRDKSTEIVCLSHLRQYGMFGQMYVVDNKGVFPDPEKWLYSSASVIAEHPIGCRWHDQSLGPGSKMMIKHPEYRGQMWEYLDGNKLTCPTFRRFARAEGCENTNHNRQIDIVAVNSYSMNGYLGSSRIGGVLKKSQARGADKVFFFAEENSWRIAGNRRESPLSTKALDNTALLITQRPGVTDCFATYHNASRRNLNGGYGNVVFVDGHVDQITAAEQRGLNTYKKMSRTQVRVLPGGNLFWAWASKDAPPGGWENQ